MTAAELLAELRHRGVRLEAIDDRLRYAAPKGALTPDLRAAMADRKAELLACLAGASPAPIRTVPAPVAAPEPPPHACPDCGAAVTGANRCPECWARWDSTPVPWCAAIDCQRPQSGRDQGFCSAECRARTEEAPA